MGDLFENLTQPEPSPPQEKRCIKHLLGLVNRGTFTATPEEFYQIVMSEHEAKIEGLARYVLTLPTKEARRKWLDQFEAKHNLTVAEELKERITQIHRERVRASGA